MPCRHGNKSSLEIKFDISKLEHDIQRLQADLEFTHKQSMLIRKAIEEKENSMRELFLRLERHEEANSRARRDTNE
ncbi:MAG: hypothetical protein EA442_04670 [Candidatus Nitrosopelagicus sp.]|nr:MAG: hypothetical protein EA442_04670 [Candidatus Nitrosopelagicus sp.]